MEYLLSLSFIQLFGYVALTALTVFMMQFIFPSDILKTVGGVGLKPVRQIQLIVQYFRRGRIGLPWPNLIGVILYAGVLSVILSDALTFYHQRAVVENRTGYFYLDKEGRKQFAYCYRMCNPDVLLPEPTGDRK